MIKYNMQCSNGHVFESWFKDSANCDKLVKAKALDCPHCGDGSISKSIMAPSIPKKSNQKSNKSSTEWFNENFLNVGDKFADEVRAIHYGESDVDKGIYGTVSEKESKALKNEGIDFIELKPEKTN